MLPGLQPFDEVRFTEGDCHYLARAVHRKTGWPMGAFSFRGYANAHAFARMPDGRWVDVYGPQTEGAAQRRWKMQHSIEVFDWRDLREFGLPQFGDYTYRRARVVADRLLGALKESHELR